jgi:hypothetical protein
MKLHLACSKDDLRPTMSHIQLKNGFLYATNAHIVVKVHYSEVGMQEIFSEEDEIYFHMDSWKNFFSKHNKCNLEIDKERKVITGYDKKYAKVYFDYIPAIDFDKIGTYPNVECVINYDKNEECNPFNLMGIDFSLGKLLQDALGLERCAVRFLGDKKQMQIFDPAGEKNAFGILMPCFITKEFKINYPKSPVKELSKAS